MKSDRARFGKAIKNTREQRGLTQQEVADRTSAFYGDVRAYRRIENGERGPDRDPAIAILVRGLELTDIATINSLLALADYEGLAAAEIADLGLPSEGSSQGGGATATPADDRPLNRPVAVVIVAVAVIVSGWLCNESEYGISFGFVLCVLYSGLYVVSLLLESAYEPQSRRFWIQVAVFCLILLTSSTAVAFDLYSVGHGSDRGLPYGLSIFLIAAVVQTVISCRTLPDYPIVKSLHQTHSAQAGHIKNTCYFLLLVVLFWLPPLHAISALRRDLRLGHTDFVRNSAERWVLVGHGMVSLNYTSLLILFIVIAGISLPMRTQLLDSLRPHPRQNEYLHLFYARALLYFTLSALCIGWYAYSVGSLLDQIGPSSFARFISSSLG